MSEEINEVKCISVNPEGTAFAIGLTKGIVAYDLNPLKRKFNVIFGGGFSLKPKEEELVAVELVSNTSYIAVAYNRPADGNSSIVVYDVRNTKYVSQRDLPGPVTCMKVLYNPESPASSKLCVGTSGGVHVYSIHEPGEPWSVPCTPRSLSISALGQVLVTENEKELVVVRDFCGEVLRRALNRNNNARISAVSWSGQMAATASKAGTVIKVVDLGRPDAPVLELSRGSSHHATVTSMSFSRDDKMLAISTDRETIHVFSLDSGRQQSWLKMKSADSAVKISPPKSDPPNSPDAVSFSNSVVTFCSDFELVVITHKGDYLIYDIDLGKGTATQKPGTRPTNLSLLEL